MDGILRKHVDGIQHALFGIVRCMVSDGCFRTQRGNQGCMAGICQIRQGRTRGLEDRAEDRTKDLPRWRKGLRDLCIGCFAERAGK